MSNGFLGLLSWVVLSSITATLIKFSIMLSTDYNPGFWGPFLLVQSIIFMSVWIRESSKE